MVLWVAGLVAVGLLAVGTYSLATVEPIMAKPVVGQAPVIFSVKTQKLEVALTFDDGPSPAYTPAILDLLKKYGETGTFFLVGTEVERHPQLVRDILKEGSEVGAHGFSHVSLAKATKSVILQEVTKVDDAIREVTGTTPRFFRPPYGAIGPVFKQVIAQKGQLVAMWTIDTRDWAKPGVTKIVQSVLSELRPGDIILLHDSGGSREETLAALKLLLPQLRAKGYTSVTLSQLMNDGTKLAGSSPTP